MPRSPTPWLPPLLALALVGLGVVQVASVLGPLHRPRQVLETDHRAYIAMAQAQPGRNEVPAPFAWRIAAPELVRAATRNGLDLHLAFWLLTHLCLVGYLWALHALLRASGADPAEAALGTALVGLLPGAARWYSYQYWMTDPPGLLLVTLGLLCVRTGREAPLPLLGMLGMATRETYVLVFVYHALARWRRDGALRALVRAAAFALPGLAVAAWIRLQVAPRPDESLLATAAEALAFRWRHLFGNQIYFATVASFGALLALALAFPRRTARALRERPEDAGLLAGAYASLALANNTDRLLAYAAPALVLPALAALRVAAGPRRPWAAWAAAALVVQALLVVRTPFRVEGISLYLPFDPWTTLAALVLLLAARRAGQAGRGAPACVDSAGAGP